MLYIAIETIIGIVVCALIIKKCPAFTIVNRKVNNLLSVVLTVVYPLVFVFLLRYSWAEYMLLESKRHMLLNYVIAAIIIAIFMLILPKVQWGVYASFVFAAIMGLTNTEVVRFRMYPIAPVDVVSIRTAAAVAKGYNIFFTEKIGITLAVMFLAIILIGIQKSYWNDVNMFFASIKGYIFRLVLAIVVIIATITWITKVDFYERYNLTDYPWEPNQTYNENGFLASFCAQLHDMFPNKPEGYSASYTDQVIAEGVRDFDNKGYGVEDNNSNSPVVLMIMNESFTDYSMLGDFDAANDYLSFFHSMKNNPGTLEYGYTYTSTYGGGTHKSEFEGLTECSMANVESTLPYMMFDFNDMNTVVSAFNEEGYTTIASHPAFPTNWRRNKVYTEMGFDDFLDIDDFKENWDVDSRGYLSDVADYERLIKEIETHDDPLFLFNVTMQNHGGYNMDELGDIAVDIDEQYNGYADARIFAGDMKKSDEALSYLIGEISKMDRPVVVCFFGDHQPGLNDEFVNMVIESEASTASNGAELEQKKYVTPYFIWTNQKDLAVKYQAPVLSSADVNIITPTYLGVMSRLYGGCELTDYEKYMISLRDSIPVLNTVGVYDSEAGFVSSIDIDSLSEDSQKRLNDYACAEYQRIYDK
ncbi:MAG: LTA synthase family protein [Lachnospiraceae bacterium]|nr:LTA synthase family protein [Lachnospiraceae bacterium]